MGELDNIFGNTEQLWEYIKKYAFKAGREATRVVLELYYVVKSPHTPTLDKTLIIAALGYQLLPDDRKLLSREKYGLLGLVDNGAAIALAYNRVKNRVTPQIEAQVNIILDQWLGSEQIMSSNDDNSDDMESYHPASMLNINLPIVPNRYDEPLDDEDVIID